VSPRAQRKAARRPVVLWGGTGQAKVLREALDPGRFEVVAVFDRDPAVQSPFDDVPIVHGVEGFARWLAGVKRPARVTAFVAIGGERGEDRLEIQRRLAAAGLTIGSVVHPKAFVARDATLGEGAQILALAGVCTGARLGAACIVNTAATVDHECVLGDGVHVAPGAHLAGCVTVGSFAMIGTGASVLPRVTIGARATVGAGAVVLEDVADGATVVGNPARPIERTRTA
jgi:sugar O-acyltransferase (sialic acid O-acetyltransferase NeuD family)